MANGVKIAFMGAGSTVFVKNVLGDCMYKEALKDAEIALYDIDATRLKESEKVLSALCKQEKIAIYSLFVLSCQKISLFR